MTRLRVAPEAEEELAAAVDWYEARRVGLGAELVADVDRALEAILEAPVSHPLWQSDRPYRRLVLQRFPFVIFFQHEDEDVVIVAIAHARRRPGYWTRRATR